MNTTYKKQWPTKLSSVNLLDESVHVPQAPVRIRHYFVFSLFSAICLCPVTGLIALAYSLKSSAKADVKFHDKARLYSRRALLWNIISAIIAVISFVVILAFCYQINAMVDADTQRMYQRYQTNDINTLLEKLTQNN